MFRQVTVASAAVVFALAGGRATAATLPATSLNNCQAAVETATNTFVSNKLTALGTCLQAISTQIVKNNAPDAVAAAGICVAELRRVNDSRGFGKQLSDKLNAAIVKKCDPTYQTPSGALPNTHTLADILGAGAGVPQPLAAENLNAWCTNFGGDGSIDSLQEWIDCLSAAAECNVDTSIASQYPRALEWLALVKPSVQAIASPVADPSKVADAMAALDAITAELDGPDNDGVVSLQCGGGASTGTATPSDVRAGQTFSNSTMSNLIGTMPDNGALTLTPGVANQPIPEGYHNGAGYCAGDASLLPGNIKRGAAIFGVNGNLKVVDTSSGTATAAELAGGKIAWVAGTQVTGSMPNNGALTLTPSTTDQAIPAGYHNGAGACSGDTDLVPGNIRSGVNLFGINGSSSVVNTTGATASAADIASGKTAYANGSLLTGTIPAGADVTGPSGSTTFTIPDGLYSGTKTATANDTNLTAPNIRSGATIFGVAGSAPAAAPLKTGQTNSYSVTGSDGAVQKGVSRSLTDNGDGTITDNQTGLMWEKKDQVSGGIHNSANTYTWTTMTTTFLATLNNGGGFAGHTDWRIPNLNELQSIVNYGTSSGPAVDAPFNTNCAVNCTVLTCSCTSTAETWSTTTYQLDSAQAWPVSFGTAYVYHSTKTIPKAVRAVRGG